MASLEAGFGHRLVAAERGHLVGSCWGTSSPAARVFVPAYAVTRARVLPPSPLLSTEFIQRVGPYTGGSPVANHQTSSLIAKGTTGVRTAVAATLTGASSCKPNAPAELPQMVQRESAP